MPKRKRDLASLASSKGYIQEGNAALTAQISQEAKACSVRWVVASSPPRRPPCMTPEVVRSKLAAARASATELSKQLAIAKASVDALEERLQESKALVEALEVLGHKKAQEKGKRKERRAALAQFGLNQRGEPKKRIPGDRPPHFVREDGLFQHGHVPGRFSSYYGMKIPFLRQTQMGTAMLQELQQLELEMLQLKRKVTVHKYGANQGYYVGYSVVSGGQACSAYPGSSGTIQVAPLVRKHPDLRGRLWGFFARLEHALFEGMGWYEVLKKRLKFVPEGRVVPGTCFSGLWMTSNPKGESPHVDGNVVGLNVVLGTSAVVGGDLCVHDPANGKLHRINVGAGTVVYGQWAQAPHTNSKMERKERAARRTWTLYLDKRVLNANYAVHVPGGEGGRA